MFLAVYTVVMIIQIIVPCWYGNCIIDKVIFFGLETFSDLKFYICFLIKPTFMSGADVDYPQGFVSNVLLKKKYESVLKTLSFLLIWCPVSSSRQAGGCKVIDNFRTAQDTSDLLRVWVPLFI